MKLADKRRTKKAPTTANTAVDFYSWSDHHSGHSPGPWLDVKIGVYYCYICPCGDRKSFTESEGAPGASS